MSTKDLLESGVTRGLESCRKHGIGEGAANEIEVGGCVVSAEQEESGGAFPWLTGLLTDSSLMLLATGDVLCRFREGPGNQSGVSGGQSETKV